MDRLFDDIARSLAKPLPRRTAFKIIAGMLFGALVPRIAEAACNSG